MADANRSYDLWPLIIPPFFVPDGTYVIYAKFRDAANNTHETSASIKADTHAPTIPPMSAVGSLIPKPAVNLSCDAITDGYHSLNPPYTWHPGSGVAWWQIKRGASPDNFDVPLLFGLGAPASVSCIDTGQLQAGKTYYYQLKAMDNIGNLALGDVVQVRLPSTTAPLLLLLLD